MVEEKTKTKAKQMGKGLGIASMVCGIVAVVFCWTIYLSIICGIVALVLGIIALVKKAEGKGMPIAGVVTGAIGLVISVVILILGIVAANKIADAVESVTTDEAWSELEVDACLEENGVDPGLDWDEMTEEEQDIYWDCL
jgi:ABC-type dipeptide/oligopeptide/nickel transport system permease component